MVGDAHHDLHVVLDQQHRQALLGAKLLDELRERHRLLGVHACGRLVEEQQLRLGRERASDLEPPLVAVGEVLREVVLDAPQGPSTRAARAPRSRALASSLRTLGVLRTAVKTFPFRRECMPTSTFSSEVMFWKRRMFWKVRPTPRSVNACGGLPVKSSPANTMRPAVGLYTPVSMLKNVVFPAPFGPIRLAI